MKESVSNLSDNNLIAIARMLRDLRGKFPEDNDAQFVARVAQFYPRLLASLTTAKEGKS